MTFDSARFDTTISVSINFHDGTEKDAVRIVTRRDWAVGTLPRDITTFRVRVTWSVCKEETNAIVPECSIASDLRIVGQHFSRRPCTAGASCFG